MKIWVDAQLSPAIAAWIKKRFNILAQAVKELGLRDASDEEIFHAAKKASAIVMTKDSDFLRLLEQHGPPPRIIWLACGNTSNENLTMILESTLKRALDLISSGDSLVEISQG